MTAYLIRSSRTRVPGRRRGARTDLGELFDRFVAVESVIAEHAPKEPSDSAPDALRRPPS